MTNQKVYRLWRSQSKRWLRWLMLGFLVIGFVTALQTTQLQKASVTPTAAERTQQIKNYRQHPSWFRVKGQTVSLAAYNDYQNQFFPSKQFQASRREVQVDRTPNLAYGCLALLAGIIFAFWGRRTHYMAFLLNLGATRTQVFMAQVRQFGLLVVTVAVAQLIHWTWIITMIPAKYQLNRALSGLFGSSVAVVLTSASLLVLGWLVGQVSRHVWLAGFLGLLSWRFLNGALSNSGYLSLVLGNDILNPGMWLYVHYYIASGLAVLGSVMGLAGLWRLYQSWSSEAVGFSAQSGLNMGLLIGIMAIGIGSFLGDTFLYPFFNGMGPWYEIVGILLSLLAILVGCWWQRHHLKGGHLVA